MQPFSWIALSDVVLAIKFLLEHPAESGAFNLVAGEVVTQFAFAKALASHLHKPMFMWLPARVIKLLFGQMGESCCCQGRM